MNFYELSKDFIKRDVAFDDTASLKDLKKKLAIRIVWNKGSELEFEIDGIYPGLINAYRRILLAEVPSMAVEKVLMINNTSLVQDEVLSHRLGLIPLKADARLFQFPAENFKKFSDRDSLQYEFNTSCKKKPNSRGFRNEDQYINHIAYSSHIKWIPIGGQSTLFKEEDVEPVIKDIVIAKLRPGHEINCKLIAVKGIGQDHAKFSPVGTATYRLLPFIKLKRDVFGKEAQLLQSCFSPGVIGLTKDEPKKAYVKNARIDMASRNIYRHKELEDAVEMGRIAGSYICNIESVNAMLSTELFIEAVKILKNKCTLALNSIKDE